MSIFCHKKCGSNLQEMVVKNNVKKYFKIFAKPPCFSEGEKLTLRLGKMAFWAFESPISITH